MKIFQYIVKLFGEKKCLGCRKSGCFFCQQCSENIETYSPYCYVCKENNENFNVHKACQTYFPLRQVIVVTRYRTPAIKRVIRSGKYYKKPGVYSEMLYFQKDFFQKHVVDPHENTVFVPVPMYFLKKWKRGYNQADKIAETLGNICGITVDEKLLFKRRSTRSQSHLSKKERQRNLEGVFGVRKCNVVPKNSTIYLVDDVISTGSTLLEAARVLGNNGFTDIRAIVLVSD